VRWCHISESGDISGERLLVVGHYDPEFRPTEKTSTLLVDATLRKEYDALHVAIDEAKEALVRVVRQQSGSRRDSESEISFAFTPKARAK
jgi:hypothetical protein